MSENIFSLCHYGLFCIDFLKKENYTELGFRISLQNNKMWKK